MAVFRVAENGQHLLDPSGQPFFALGVNYEGYFDRAWRMWQESLFDVDLITRDLRKAQSSGFNAVRIFVQQPLIDDFRVGNFGKIDQVLAIAERAHLAVLLVLNDAHSLDLAVVAEIDYRIAEHLREAPALLGYDLENEPVFYNLAAARYPEGIQAPIQTASLVEHYGERVSQDEAQQMQDNRRIPTHLSPELAYFYANALRLFLEFDAAATEWARQNNADLLGYLVSPESEVWRHLIGVLDATLAAWLTARMDPLRAAAPDHLVSVGWNWPHLAALPANQVLDFQQFHHYAAHSLKGLQQTLDYLGGLRRLFGHHPIVLGEFGYSNASNSNSELSQPVSYSLTALYEAALMCALQAQGFAGGFKWMLNDVAHAEHNPRESGFGVYQVGDQPKLVHDLLVRLADLWCGLPSPGQMRLLRAAQSGLSYCYKRPESLIVGGGSYQDDILAWESQSDPGAHLFIRWKDQELVLEATGKGHLRLGVDDLVSGWDRAREVVLYRRQANTRLELSRVAAGQDLIWNLLPEVTYLVRPGESVLDGPPLDDVVLPEPGAGEHVLVLPDFDRHLDAARTYIRRFAPDFTLAVDQVYGRWPFVTVVGGSEGVSDAQLESMQAHGARLVERIAGDDLEATKGLLNQMAAQGRRFLLNPSAPPQPPIDETYTVQPGDTLTGISLKIYGDRRYWHAIFDANRDVLDDPGRIHPGQVLRIPPQPQN